ncbi:MAG: flavin reductase [Eubacteriales bacterium]|jgi:flavin reductase (DIM6/NTAB) family NADH-FMN oxidoreductase RutF/rubredoxin
MDKNVLRDLSYGLYAIGTLLDGKKAGCIVNTVFQVTSENPMICISMNKNNATHEGIRQTGRFTAAILSEQADPSVIGTLGFHSSRDTDKFGALPHEMAGDLPVITQGTSGYLVCQVVSFTDAETHSLILARVMDAVSTEKAVPMTYRYYHEVVKGKAPKNAPTYVEEETAAPTEEVWVCDVCGYEYHGDLTREPADFRCPMCRVDKSHFRKKV